MRTRIEKIENCISEAIQKIWPEFTEEVTVYPLLNSGSGDLGTDIFLKLAAKYSLTPEQVYSQVKEWLGESAGCEHKLEKGFLNFSFKSMDSFCPVPFSNFEMPESTSIWIPPQTPGLADPDYIRLAALAFCQFSLFEALSIPVCVHIYDSKMDESLSPQELFRLFLLKHVAGECRGSEKELLAGIESYSNETERLYVWLSPRSIPRKQFTGLLRKIDSSREGVLIRCPELSWLRFDDNEFSIAEILEWDDEALGSFLVYLCSSIPGRDLDFMTPGLNEKANLLSFISEISDRLNRFSDCFIEGNSEALVPMPLLSRGALLPLVFMQAALRGRPRDFTEYLALFLGVFTEFFNDPELRLRLHERNLSKQESQFLSGVSLLLSDIIKKWGLARVFHQKR